LDSAGHHADRCSARAEEHVVARSSVAVAFPGRLLDGDGPAKGFRLDRRGEPWSSEEVRVHGTWVAYDITYAERHQTTQALYRTDALHVRDRQTLAVGSASDVVIGRGGTVVYVTVGGPG
jgi:hypothetical protein